jgi:hypothetical protein
VTILSGVPVLAPPNSSADAYYKDKDGFDLEYCQAECRRAYGGDAWSAPFLRRGAVFGYNACLVKCQQKQWDALDREADRDLK